MKSDLYKKYSLKRELTMKTKLSIMASVLLFSGSALYADVQTVGSPITNPVPAVKKSAPILKNDTEILKEESTVLNDTRTIFVKSFDVKGNKVISTEELLAVLKPYENTNMTMKQINEAILAVTKKYRQKGYFSALAYVAPNAYKEGVLTISISKGAFGSVKLENTSLVSDDTLRTMFESLKGQDATADSLEQKAWLISDLAGIKLSTTRISAGMEPGTVDIVFKTIPTPKYDGYFVTDNYGSRYTGENRLGAGINANSPLGIGDRLSLAGMLSSGAGTKNGSIDYTAPLTSEGLTLGLGYYRSQYVLGDSYSSLDATGTTSAIQAKFSYPLVRNGSENLAVSFNPQVQHIKDDESGSSNERKANVGVFGADYAKIAEIFDISSTLRVKFNYTTGRLMFQDSAFAAADANGADTQGSFSKIDSSITLSSLVGNEVSLKQVFNSQYALKNKNLDPSMYITIGGANGVRAFPVTQESGSSGYIYTAELSQTLPIIGTYSHTAYMFYDAGRAFNPDTSVVPFTSSILQDVGVGYKINDNMLFAKFELARVVGGTEVSGVPSYLGKGLFQVGIVW